MIRIALLNNKLAIDIDIDTDIVLALSPPFFLCAV